MKRPAHFVYWQDEVPPNGITVLSALQHIGLTCSVLPIPIAVARAAGLPPAPTANLVAISMLVLGIATILQTMRRGAVGSGLLAPATFAGAYLGPSILAVKTGGLALVFCMTMLGGVVEAILSRLLRFLRPFLPPEIAGFVVVLVGLTVGGFGVRYVLGVDAGQPASPYELAVSLITLGLMVGFNVWGRGLSRLFCALIGIAAGYVAAAWLGVLSAADFQRVLAEPFFALPRFAQFGWSFDSAFVIPFAIAAVATCLKSIGDLTTALRINDAEWSRPDMTVIGRGTLAAAICTVIAGLAGTTAQTTSSASIGLAGATGVTSRRVGFATGAIFIALAFFPQLTGLLAIMPPALMGAALMFVAAFILVSGLGIIASRLLDVRRSLVIGLSFIIAIAVDISPAYFQSLSPAIQPLASSSLVAGMLTAILLNLVFRIGVRKVQRLEIDPQQVDTAKLAEFIDDCGATWGARRDVIERAKFNLLQSIETLAGTVATGPLAVEATFDEFNVTMRLSYAGMPLELPTERPSDEEIIESEDGERRLAGFMLRRFADRVSAVHRDGRATITFAFVH